VGAAVLGVGEVGLDEAGEREDPFTGQFLAVTFKVVKVQAPDVHTGQLGVDGVADLALPAVQVVYRHVAFRAQMVDQRAAQPVVLVSLLR